MVIWDENREIATYLRISSKRRNKHCGYNFNSFNLKTKLILYKFLDILKFLLIFPLEF